MNLTINLFFLLLVSGNRWAIEISCLSSVTPIRWSSSCVRFAGESKGNIGIPEIERQSLLEYCWMESMAAIPEVFQKYLVKVSDIHSHNTRYASNLNFHVLRVRSNSGKHTFKFAITKILEETPTNIKTLSYFQFKKTI